MSLKAIWAENTPYSKFLLAVGIILISATFFTLLGLAGAVVMYDIPFGDLEKILADTENPTTLSILKFVQVVSTIGTFVLPSLVIAWLYDPRPAEFLCLTRKVQARSVLLVVVALVAALPLINFLGELNSHMSLPSFLSGVESWMKASEAQAAQLLEKFLDMENTGDLFFNLFMIGLLPAIGEELLFRGVVQRLFAQWLKNKHAAIWLTAFLFSALHMQFYGFLPRMLLGGLLGYLLVWSGSLWLPICAHFVNNATAILFTWLYRREVIGVDADAIGTQNDMTSVLISLVLTALLIGWVYRDEKRLRPQAVAG